MKFKDALSVSDKKMFKKAIVNTKLEQKSAEKESASFACQSQEPINETQLFKQSIGKVKPLVQDKTQPIKKHISKKQSFKSNAQNKQHAEFYFSDEFEPNLNAVGPIKYVREGVDSFEAKKLRRGHYSPDLILDLHGFDQIKAKQEIAALLYACQKEHVQCICIVHGLGSRVLKNKVPHWLVQHPRVMAFHQASLEWGGNGALLVLIELKDKYIGN